MLFPVYITPSISQNNIDTLCTHNADHTSRDELFDDLRWNKPGDNTTTSVLWSGHKVTSTKANGEAEENRSASWLHYVLMLDRTGGENREQYSMGILMHELCHQFGAQDHYHEEDADENCVSGDICSTCGSDSRPRSCIMNISESDISSEDILCEDCKNDILEHLQKHHE